MYRFVQVASQANGVLATSRITDNWPVISISENSEAKGACV